MYYPLTEEQKMIRDLARQFAEDRVRPVAAELDEKEEFPRALLQELAAMDMFRVFVPEEYGGLGKDPVFSLCLVTEEISKVCSGVAVSYAASALGAFPIILFGNEEQKKKYLPPIADGAKLAAFALTEPEAGSDAGGIATTAREEGDCFVLNGTKQWITNGGEADVYTVIALTDKSKGPRGASAFILERGMEGFEFGKKEKKLGIRCSATRELIFRDCRVPKENLLGRKGMGFLVAMKTFDASRPGIGAQAVGIAQGAIDLALEYARQRIQFGKPIVANQAIQHKLAEMQMRTEAARALVYTAAHYVDSGAKDLAKISAMAKAYAADVAMFVTTEAVQIFGGYGYMRDYPIEKYFRDAKITQIYEGTNEIQRNVIALEMIREAAAKRSGN